MLADTKAHNWGFITPPGATYQGEPMVLVDTSQCRKEQLNSESRRQETRALTLQFLASLIGLHLVEMFSILAWIDRMPPQEIQQALNMAANFGRAGVPLQSWVHVIMNHGDARLWRTPREDSRDLLMTVWAHLRTQIPSPRWVKLIEELYWQMKAIDMPHHEPQWEPMARLLWGRGPDTCICETCHQRHLQPICEVPTGRPPPGLVGCHPPR